jgi:hypothetical protein
VILVLVTILDHYHNNILYLVHLKKCLISVYVLLPVAKEAYEEVKTQEEEDEGKVSNIEHEEMMFDKRRYPVPEKAIVKTCWADISKKVKNFI